MRRDIAALACVGWLLAAAGAGAETWRLLEGTLTDADTGHRRALTGSFTASPLDGGALASEISLLVDDFDLRAGRRSFTPRGPIEYNGFPSSLVSLADQIQVQGDEIGFVRLHAGGLLAADAETVAFRTFEFRSGGAPSGQAVGQFGDTALPRRIELAGVLYQVDDAYLVPVCLPLRNPLNPVNPANPTNSWSDRDSANGSRLLLGSQPSLYLLDPPTLTTMPVSDAGLTIGRPPRLEDHLAEVGTVVLPIQFFPFCRLVRATREERLLGAFALVATAAQPVEIDVLPGRRNARVEPGSMRRLPVALLGSADLDVRDVIRNSLRIGPAEAEPLSRARRLRVDRDRRLDLLLSTRARDAGIAYGDTRLCMHGETRDGVLFEGCDAIDTLPPVRRRGR